MPWDGPSPSACSCRWSVGASAAGPAHGAATSAARWLTRLGPGASGPARRARGGHAGRPAALQRAGHRPLARPWADRLAAGRVAPVRRRRSRRPAGSRWPRSRDRRGGPRVRHDQGAVAELRPRPISSIASYLDAAAGPRDPIVYVTIVGQPAVSVQFNPMSRRRPCRSSPTGSPWPRTPPSSSTTP